MCTKKANSGFSAFLKQKCPRCRRGQIFVYPLTKLSRFQEMHEHCPVCGVKLEPETGFYWGAMYISYAISVAIAVTLCVAIRVLFGEGVSNNIYIATVLLALIVGTPINIRFSRALMLSYLSGIKYDPTLDDGQ